MLEITPKLSSEEIKMSQNQFELFELISEGILHLENTNLLKVISDNALAQIDSINLKNRILVDDTEHYKFDDTMRYDE